MSESGITREELASLIRSSVKEAFRDVGLHTEEAEQLELVREDFRFVRKLRTRCESYVNKVGTAVVMAIVGGILTVVGMGFKVFVGK